MLVEVTDNFLPDYQFKQIQNVMMGDYFPWFYNSYTCYPGDKNPMFTHTFFALAPPWSGKKSSQFSLWEGCLQKLGCQKLFRIKSNLNVRTVFPRHSDYHIDYTNNPPIKTVIFYMNTCNGYTKFKKGGKVKSVANRLVIFDSNLEHAGVTCTDKESRVVVNFNYVPAL